MKDLKLLQNRAQADMTYDKEEWKKFVMATFDLNGPLAIYVNVDYIFLLIL